MMQSRSRFPNPYRVGWERSGNDLILVRRNEMIMDAVKKLEQANMPSKHRTFYVWLETPEDEQRYAELMGWA